MGPAAIFFRIVSPQDPPSSFPALQMFGPYASELQACARIYKHFMVMK
jgi:hypothetical protein